MAGAKDLAPTDSINHDLLTALKKLADGADELRKCIEKCEAKKCRNTDESLRELSAHSSQGEDNDQPEPCDLTQEGRVTRYGYGDAVPKWLHDEFEQTAPTEKRLEDLWQGVRHFFIHHVHPLNIRIQHQGDTKEFTLTTTFPGYFPNEHGRLGNTVYRFESVDGKEIMEAEVLMEIIRQQWPRSFGDVIENRDSDVSGGITEGRRFFEWKLKDVFPTQPKRGFITKRILINDEDEENRDHLPPHLASPSFSECWTFYRQKSHLTVELLAFLAHFHKNLESAFFCVENLVRFRNSWFEVFQRKPKDMFFWKLRACWDVRIFSDFNPTHCEFPLHRHEGWVGRINRSSEDGFRFSEWNSANFLTVRHERDCTTYKVFNWRDDDPYEHYLDDDREIYYKLENYGIKNCGKEGRAYSDFLANIVRSYLVWYTIWIRTLDAVDKLVGIKLDAALDEEYLKTLMFDASFQVSEKYFSALQILRIFQAWIEETPSDFDKFTSNLIRKATRLQNDSPYANDIDIDWEVLERNVDVVKERLAALARDLVNRIEKKREELESLRDGLFNAASLKEAVRSRTLNLFVIVFTIVTIIFTPLGFLATLWAMPNLSNQIDGRNGASTPKSFYLSWIILPLGTYFAAAFFLLVAWAYSSPDAKNLGKDFILRARVAWRDRTGG